MKGKGFEKFEFVLGSVNIQGGIERKLKHGDVQKLIAGCDFITMQETWLLPGESVHMEGYETFRSNRKPKKKARKGVDGILVMHKSKYKTGISRQNSKNEKCTIWMKLEKSFFGFENDLFVVAGYFPYKRADEDSFWQKLELDILNYSTKGDVFVMGDLNSRIGTSDQHITYIEVDMDNQHDLLTKTMHIQNKRCSQDKTITKRGRDLLSLCNKSDLIILNGRKLGDLNGSYTCHKYNGSSVNDVMIASNELYHKIKYFNVLEPVWFSDHCPIVCAIDVNIYSDCIDTGDLPTNIQPVKFKWDDSGATLFNKALVTQGRDGSLLPDDLYNNNVHDLAEKMENALFSIASETLETISPVKGKPKGNNRWMNNECFAARKKLKQTKNIFLKTPFNLDRRAKFLYEKKKYKQMLYMTKKCMIEKNRRKLGEMSKKSPNDFWKSLKKLLSETKEQKANHISPKIWHSYFKNLLSTKGMGPSVNTDNTNVKGPLDTVFSTQEIIDKIKALKNNKSTSTPIINEMLKCNPELIATTLKPIFNRVLSTRTYPKMWNLSFISPLFKAGDCSDTGNYRGICVGNAIGKLFNKCVNERLDNYLMQNNLLPENSFGFRKGIQTEHAMHVLKTVTSQYKQLGKKVYTAFVDFSKFYDTIRHDLLFEKLEKIGICGSMLGVIKSMYGTIDYAIKLKYEHKVILTDSFVCNIGLKQGCPLSPTLANIFLSDIHPHFFLDDIFLGTTPLNSIAWADDLVIFSASPQGLQSQLAELEKYCRKWKLVVNIDKTKCLIFSSNVTTYDFRTNFTFNGESLLFVTTFKYLGIEFQQNGLFTRAIKNRILKAQAAIFMIRKACQTDCQDIPSVELINTLFNSKIIPILTYGSSIWGPKSNNSTYCTFPSNERLTNKVSVQNYVEQKTGFKPNIKSTNKHPKDEAKTVINFQTYKDKLAFNRTCSTHQLLGIVEPIFPEPNLHREVEKCQLKFLKNTLQVKKTCSDINIRFEVGAYPLYLNYIPKYLKFFHSLRTTKNLVLKQSYICSMLNATEWAEGIQYTLQSLGLNDLMSTPRPPSANLIKYNAKCILKENYHVVLRNHNSTKFTSLKPELPDNYTYRPYLNKIQNTTHRNTLTRLRTHTHCLLTETHYYTTNTSTTNECPNCLQCPPETVRHFLLECSNGRLSILRNKFLALFPRVEDNGIFLKNILSCQIPNALIKPLYAIIHDMYTKRANEELEP